MNMMQPDESPRSNESATDEITSDCQLCGIYDCATNLKRSDEAAIWGLRLRSALRRRLQRLAAKLRGGSKPMEEDRPRVDLPKLTFSEGDRVRIKSVAAIRASLDENGALNGLVFLSPMEEYCGGEYTVMKRVRRIYDEREERMVRLRDAYILDGVICKGRNVYAKEGCDRCCPFFWRSQWLEKV